MDNPHFWLSAYGVRSHYFVWAVAHGALDDIDPPTPVEERWVQPSLLEDVEDRRSSRPPAPRLYRSRAPVRSDVYRESLEERRIRAQLGIKLADRYVLRA